MNENYLMTMIKKYWITNECFEIPISDKEIVDYINTYYTKEEKLKLFEGMAEKRMKETIKMVNNLKTNGEFISTIRTLLKRVNGTLTLTERSAILNMMDSIIDKIPVKDYSKN